MVLAQPSTNLVKFPTPTRFHPTMVLAQRRMYLLTRTPAKCFHPTMVLAQHIIPTSTETIPRFPSHYGSRSTAFITKNYTGLQGVKSNRS